MSKRMVLTEYYELCEGGVCDDLLTEAEKLEARMARTRRQRDKAARMDQDGRETSMGAEVSRHP